MGARSTLSTSRHRPPLRALLAVGLAALLGLAGPVAAQEPPPDPGLGLLEAVELMMRNDPNLGRVEARLSSSQGVLLSARGSFDPVVRSSMVQSRTDSPLSESSQEEQRVLQNTLGVSKLFRSGLSITPELDLLRTEDLGVTAPGVNVGTVAFTVRQPLLRGRGRATTAAVELSAERGVAASRLDLRHATSERILSVVAQYWNYRAAMLNLEILTESEARSRELLETTRKLIEADVTPAAELVQVEANLASQETSRISGERALFQARQDLGREIGLDFRQIANLPLPSDPFPMLRPEEAPPRTSTDRYIAAALERRDDLRAARERRQGTEALVRAAENALKPQVDLVFRPSYSGLVLGDDFGNFYSPLFQNVPGLSSSLSLSLAWPTANREARGDRLQIQAAQRENDLVVETFVKAIGADVPTALDAVSSQALRLQKAEEAVRLFERAVANEEKKLRAGTSTLIDVITQRDRLTNARQSRVSAQLDLALALADLRFQTGTLLASPAPGQPDPEQEGTVEYHRLTTLPAAEETTP